MTTTPTPPDHFPGATKMIAALEDDVKPIRDALAGVPRMAWALHGHNVIIPDTEEGNSEGLINFAAIFNKLVGKKFARYVAACNPARIARLLAHIDAQAVLLVDAERLAADRLEQMNADRKQALVWRDQAELYEQVRKFSPREFQALWTKNVTSGAMFDDLVRAAIKEAKT